MDEKQLLKQLTEIANKEGYVLIPRSLYERMFNAVEILREELEKSKKSRDSWKKKLRIQKKK